MERMQTKALVEGAIFSGITTVLGIIYYYTQYLGIVGLLWPVPTVIVGYRNGVKASILPWICIRGLEFLRARSNV